MLITPSATAMPEAGGSWWPPRRRNRCVVPAPDATVYAIGKTRSIERRNKALALLLNAKISRQLAHSKRQERYPCRFIGADPSAAETSKKIAFA